MSFPASRRFRITPAPEGLSLVHELLNTIPVRVVSAPDLLVDLDAAQRWASAAAKTWARQRGRDTPDPILTKRDLPRLRALREQTRASLAGHAADADVSRISGALDLDLETGSVVATPRGRGSSWFGSAVLAEIFLAQQDDTWRRLKTCRNPHCAVAFYDRTRNNNGVWHDVHACGNAANLRASRARRRARESA